MSAGSTQNSTKIRTRGSAVAALLFAAVMGASRYGRAAGVEPARVRVTASLIDDVVRKLLPLDIVLPAPLVGAPGDGGAPAPSTPAPVTITDLRYCGATDKGNGRWRAVLRTGAGGGGESPLLASDDACRQTLEDLQRRLAEGRERDDGIGVADVEAVWRQWELRLLVARLVGPGGPKPGGPRPLAAMENRRELLVVSTANFRVMTDAGETLTFHAAPAFTGDSVDLVVFLGENGGAPPAGRPGSGGHFPALSDGVTVAAEFPDAFANQLLRQLTATRPLAVPIDRDVIDVQNVTVAGASAGLTVTGVATPRSVRETMRVSVQVAGDEARVAAVRADAQLESCAGLGTLAALACNARNAARSAAAAALGAGLTQKYRGQLVRDLAGPQTVRFDVGRRRLELQGDLLHVTAGARGLGAAARFSARGGADH